MAGIPARSGVAVIARGSIGLGRVGADTAGADAGVVALVGGGANHRNSRDAARAGVAGLDTVAGFAVVADYGAVRAARAAVAPVVRAGVVVVAVDRAATQAAAGTVARVSLRAGVTVVARATCSRMRMRASSR